MAPVGRGSALLWLPITPSAVAAAPALTLDPSSISVKELSSRIRSSRGRASGRPALLRRDASSCGALVSMMQAANLGQLEDPAQCGALHRPGLRRIAHQ